MKSRVSEAAVPFELQDAAGGAVRLDDFSGGWLLLVFHRHLG
jgi:peroxiredoxin